MILPSFDELPEFGGQPGCAWSVWSDKDELGTVNFLTEEVVKRAAQEEIRPVNFPENPAFKRKPPEVTQSLKIPQVLALRDDEVHFLKNSSIPADSLPLGRHPIPDPLNIDPKLTKLGIQNWAKHGICGRGVLLDLVRFYTEGGKDLPYDPFDTHAIGVADLEACAKKQGVEFRQGDILLLRVGFIRKYNTTTNQIRAALGSEEETLNNHFAAVASDQPALERWPAPEGTHHLHETLLGQVLLLFMGFNR
ncbi:hypothetical protein C0995_013773 [Termitomyces sp. Mi166|nr:hypothetical protein C0995_013773 [Termitomyces sp. Mi166\